MLTTLQCTDLITFLHSQIHFARTAIRNLALKFFRLGGSRLIMGLRCTFGCSPPPPSLHRLTLKHAPLEARLPSPSWGRNSERIKQRTTQLNSVSFNEAGIFNVSPGLAHRIVAECNILNKKRCVEGRVRPHKAVVGV